MAPPTAGQRPQGHHLPGIEGLRGVAALLVLIYHVGVYSGQVGSSQWQQRGNPFFGPVLARAEVGLPVFFVLSGALLYRPFALATRANAAPPATGPYLWRRALRVLPAYWVLVGLSLPLLNREALHGVWDVVRPVLLLHIYQQDVLPAGMGHTWSLAVEISFYLLLPLAAALLARSARRRHDPVARARRVLWNLAVVAGLSVAYTVYSHGPALGAYPMESLWLPEYLVYFAAGMAAAMLSACRQGELRVWRPYDWLVEHPAASWGLAATAYAVACSPLTGSRTVDYPSVAHALAIKGCYLATSMLLIVPFTTTRPTKSTLLGVLTHPVTRFLGRVSFGVFLAHLFVLDAYDAWSGTPFATAGFWPLLTLVLSSAILAATVCHYVIERPAMRLRRRLGRTAVTRA
ncbi:acyltransferase family protein [Streptomyces yerevanensis]|uniref:acyltransferase family protein n=1 Tax=Streptomyces yerevanensis TaxID=66378 RepID=UPI000526DAC2|nr:acyltransferase [Streptomyces yerevanensis]